MCSPIDWPAWIQAAAAIISTLAVVYTLSNSRKEQKETQKQIASLAQLGEESRQRQIVFERRQIPYFRSIKKLWSPKHIEATLKNHKGDAFNVKPVEPNTFFTFEEENLVAIDVPAGEALIIGCNFKNIKDADLKRWEFELEFEDVLGNTYTQKFILTRQYHVPLHPVLKARANPNNP